MNEQLAYQILVDATRKGTYGQAEGYAINEAIKVLNQHFIKLQSNEPNTTKTKD
jgi:hypothetical protein